MQGPVQSTSPHILLLAFAVVLAAGFIVPHALELAGARCRPLHLMSSRPPFSTPCVNGTHCVHRHASPPRTLDASQLLSTCHYAHYAAARRRNTTLH
ncbi:hypothetical protein FB451DRAFT_1261989 [Mycena latifolia]|nr:hypothetical protein FB451DRAFT_1261989 [Mycena latifolia]